VKFCECCIFFHLNGFHLYIPRITFHRDRLFFEMDINVFFLTTSSRFGRKAITGNVIKLTYRSKHVYQQKCYLKALMKNMNIYSQKWRKKDVEELLRREMDRTNVMGQHDLVFLTHTLEKIPDACPS
jgi:hypothetical protein